MVYGLKFRA